MNSFSPISIISFITLVLGQVLIFNHLHIFGSINPIIYLLFFVFYRFESNQTFLILISFLLGFSVDILSQSGGAHTIASLTIGFLRPLIIKYAFGVTVEKPQSYFSDSRTLNKLIFLILLIAIHHLIYFSLVYFSFDSILLIIKNMFLTLLFSLILIGITLSFYPNK
ncbi:MAG: rod shape-determining protein MreD [Flavobacteriaceae bacterium]|nr:rod shape-determining protein MreD [Flavobacteriaceae bacterium]|tara:strand:+ start:457 stop:957 length:501 start_codon:yes stop_codon:yes gene_type:complete